MAAPANPRPHHVAADCFHPTCAAPAVVNVDLNSWRNPSCMDHLGELCLRLALVASASGSTIVVTFIESRRDREALANRVGSSSGGAR